MRRISPLFVDVAAWVDSERTDPVQRRQRQVIHILLAAIASIRPQYALYLKGGLLLGLAHNSPRMTTDVDLTAGFQPHKDIAAEIRKKLDRALPEAAARLGYVGTQTRVHAIRKLPKKHAIEEARFPGLKITVEHVSAGGHRYTDRIPVDISFNEPKLGSIDILDIGGGIELHAYSLVDVIAEKYRALLQQPHRRKRRRQDVYDIHFLLGRSMFADNEKADILDAILKKCRSRGIDPKAGSIDDQEVRERACAAWDSNKLEVGALPEFDLCFESVQRFYRELPWRT